jgi:hypothetical protein
VLALDYKGNVGAASIQKGFTYALADQEGNQMIEANSILKNKWPSQVSQIVKLISDQYE